ncbi:MAG: hypothetical protein AB7O28_05945 [Vicinamibacterales bacterium]
MTIAVRTALFLVLGSAAAAAQPAPPGPLAAVQPTTSPGVVELKGTVPLAVQDAAGPRTVPKRFVLRYPATGWNGALVIGAHGGSGGNDFDPTGKVIGTDETALDDVVGRHAVSSGFAYASVDRDGAMTALAGLALTDEFAEVAAAELRARLGRPPARQYLVGLSMGGGIARAAAERPSRYAGIVIVAGANGDLPTRTARQRAIAEAWPGIDPATHPDLPATDPRIAAFARIIGTPVAARRLWPYTAAGAARAAAAPAPPGASGNSSGVITVPVVEVAGTWDDFVLSELEAYRARVTPRALHRLYLVEGVWHMSGDDDGVQSFMYLATRMRLDPDVAKAMGEGPSYLPTVRDAFDRLVDWVERGLPAPRSQTVAPGRPLAR